MIKKRSIIILLFLTLLIIFSVCFTGCGLQMKNYYKNDNNYTKLNGTFLCPIEDGKGKYLYIQYLTDKNEEIIYYFGGVEATYQVLQENCFFEEVPTNSEITFTTAFIMWCAGCRCCLAEVWYNGKCYLDFETGKAIILQSIKDGRRGF